jgi:hypothetical protein
VKQSVLDQAAHIRDFIDREYRRDNRSVDPDELYRFSVVLAGWDQARYQREKGPVTVDDDRRFAALTLLCENLSEEIGRGRELTMRGGFLAGDSARILCDTWQEATEIWVK